jgi:coproporphyrinogen III oxidase
MTEASIASHAADEFRALQRRICDALSAEDGTAFRTDPWQRPEGGGGVSRVIEGGGVFEKAAVLFSAVTGQDLPAFVLKDHPDVPPGTPYFATGVSLICHPRNPHVPTVHFNVRYFEAGPVFWFGGGMDLTPYYPVREDCIGFHRAIKACCDRHDPRYYAEFKPWCDRYFFLKHRQEPRGIGGIFFNYLRDPRDPTLAFALDLGAAFLEAYLPIVKRRRETPYSERERDFQSYRRGRYVEFNLLHDQGTLFGLQSGGRIEAILASLPPQVAWRYDWHPQPGSPEERLYREFLPPRDWAALGEPSDG